MNKLAKSFILLTILLQVYVTAIWFYVFNLFDNQVDRKLAFGKYFPPFITANVLHLLLLVVTIVSVILILKNINSIKASRIKSILVYLVLLVEAFFLFFFIFQSL
jgi:hypothetical protein